MIFAEFCTGVQDVLSIATAHTILGWTPRATHYSGWFVVVFLFIFGGGTPTY